MKIKLRISTGEASKPQFELEFSKQEILIGRGIDCDIRIQNEEVSRRHAQIVWTGKKWVVRDLQSRLGTQVNLHKVDGECPLESGDVVHVGKAQLEFIPDLGVENTDALEEKTSIVAQRAMRDIFFENEDTENQPYFRVMNGKEEGRRVSLSSAMREYLVGRGEKVDIRFTDQTVSRKHARLVRDWNTLFIEKLEGKNGLVVNGYTIDTNARLNDSDEVFLGQLHLVYHDPIGVAIGSVDSPLIEEESVSKTIGTHKSSSLSVDIKKEQSPKRKMKRTRALSSIGFFEVLLFLCAAALFGGLIFGASELVKFAS